MLFVMFMHFILIMLLPTQMDMVDERVCKLAVSWSGAVRACLAFLVFSEGVRGQHSCSAV